MILLAALACRRDPPPAPPGDPPASGPVATAGPDRRALVGEPVVLDASGSRGDTFTWTFDDGRTLAGATVEVSFEGPGHRTVVLSARTADGRVATDDAAIAVTWPRLPDAPADARALALSPSRAFVPMRDFDLLAVVERASGAVSHAPTCGVPRTVSVAADRVWVACEDDAVAVHGPDGAPAWDVALPPGSRPWGVVADADGAWVSLGGLGALARISADCEVSLRPVGEDVRGLARVGDDLLATRWRSPDDGGVVWRLDARTGAARDQWRLAEDPGPDSDTNARGLPNLLSPVVVRPDGRRVAVGGLKANVRRGLYREQRPFTHDTTSRADLRQLSLRPEEGPVGAEGPALVFDDRDQVVGIAFSPDGDWLYALHVGMEVVDVFDAYTLRRAGSASPVGRGPDALVVDGDELWVSAPLSRALTVFDLARPELPSPARTLDLLPPEGEVVPADVLAGEVVFVSSADRRMSAAGYTACGTCHPEGQHDGRTWDFTQRGEGLRDTTSLRGGAGRAPLHWSANFDEVQDFEGDIRAHQGGTGFLDADAFAGTADPLGAPKAGRSPELDALAAYVGSLAAPLRSPWRDPDPAAAEARLRGEAIFLDPAVGCADCHPPPTFTDSAFVAPGAPRLHDVGTLGPGSGARLGGPLTGLDTPTLLGVWATAPYLHDGSAPDLRAVLVDRNPDDAHGVTRHLGAAEIDDLVAFLRGLE